MYVFLCVYPHAYLDIVPCYTFAFGAAGRYKCVEKLVHNLHTMGNEGCGDIYYIHYYCETKAPIHGFVKTLRAYHPPRISIPPSAHCAYLFFRGDQLLQCEKLFLFILL